MDGPAPFLIFVVLGLFGLRLLWLKLVRPRFLLWQHNKRHVRWWRKGLADFEAQDYDNAANAFHAILNCPDCGQRTELPQTMIGMCKQLQGDMHSAIAAFESGLTLDRESTRPRKRLAYLLACAPEADLRDAARALALAGEAVELGPETDWEAWAILAAAQAESGEFDGAVMTYEHAMTMMTENERKLRQETLNQFRRQEPLRCSPEFDRSRLVRSPSADNSSYDP